MDIAKQLLAEKRKILDEVFQQARQRLQNLSDEEYRTLCTKLILETVETGEEEIVVDKSEKRLNQDLIDQVNRQLGSKGKGNLKLSDEKLNIGAGFVLKRGQIKTNVSLDVLLNQARKELEIDLAKELFQD
jgi:V/A-type H+-transporting ATPase subunit E